MSKKKSLVALTSIFVLVLVGVMISGKLVPALGGGGEETKPVKVDQIPVKVVEAKSSSHEAVLTFKANLEPVEEGIVSSKLAGKAMQIMVQDGQAVAKGDPLIVLDDQDIRNQLLTVQSQLQASQSQLDSALASVPKLKANLDNAQLSYNRIKTLFDAQAVPQSELERADMALKVAKADFAASNANVNSVRASLNTVKANLKSINDSLANAIVRAPIAGVIDEKAINLGQFVSPGGVLAKIKNISSLNAVIQVNQDDLKFIKVGQKAQITLGDDTTQTYEGVVKYIDVSANPSARVFNCKVEVSNPAGTLRPGVYTKVQISKGESNQVLSAPVEVLMGNEGDYFIYVVEEGVARKRQVTIGDIAKDKVEIQSGIKPGAKLISTNLNTIQDGDTVKVVGQGE